MKTRWFGLMAGLGALVSAYPGCSQPKAECTAGSATAGAFAATMTLVEVLDGDENSACATKKGLIFGMQTYNPDAGNVPDRTKKSVAIQTSDLGTRFADGGVSGQPYAIGDFVAVEPDDQGVCPISGLTQAELTTDGGEGGSGGGGQGGSGGGGQGGSGGGGQGGSGGGGQGGSGGEGGSCEKPPEPPPDPAPVLPSTVTYAWSDASLYVSAASLGTQFKADVVYSEPGCSAKYRVLALWPAVDCGQKEMVEVPEVDEAGCLTGETVSEPRYTGKPEPKLCDGKADLEPQYANPNGSGINPDLKVKCADFGEAVPPDGRFRCVLDSDDFQPDK